MTDEQIGGESTTDDLIDVAIIGAGFAGLSAAHALLAANKSFRIYEARERCGGRTHTSKLGGQTVDLGGQWIGPGQHRIYELVASLGLSTYQQPEHGQAVVDLGGRAASFDDPALALSEAAIVEYITAVGTLEELMSTVSPTSPHLTPGAIDLDSQTFATYLERNTVNPDVRALMTVAIQAVFATDPANLSLLHVLHYMACAGGWNLLTDTAGGAQQDKVVGGLGNVAKLWAEKLPESCLIYNTAVRRINDLDDHVELGGDDLILARARRALVCLPPTLAGRIVHSPPLPAWRDQLTQRLPGGNVIKFHIAFAKPFWRERGLSGTVISTTAPAGVFYDGTAPDSEVGVLSGFFEGSHAVALQHLGANDRKAILLEHIRAVFGDEVPEAIDYVDVDWGAEEFTRGCYGAHLPPGTWTQYGPRLRDTVGNVHWASTETATVWTGYVEGAIEAGRFAASEIVGSLEISATTSSQDGPVSSPGPERKTNV